VRQWVSVVGEALAGKATPERFERGTLWVAATGSAWAQEIALRKEVILERLNGLAGERLFEDLRVGTREPRRDLAAPRDEGAEAEE
jgi:predicted nucleic acid-binding Zn ribbon protein